TTDTLPGSSGSPAFNKDWEVVALHHSGVPEVKNGRIMTIRQTVWTKGMPDAEIHWVANEGVRISAICEALITAKIDGSQRDAWADLIATFQEDFSMLPIVQSQTEGPAAIPAPDQPQGMSVVVNGTANFYLGSAPVGSASTAVPTPFVASAAPTVSEK